MLRIVTLVGGILAGVLLALGGLYLITRLWPGLFSPAPTPTATLIPASVTPRPTLTPAPTATLDPNPIATDNPLDRVVGEDPTATAGPAGAPTGAGAGVLLITRLDLQRPYETLGFTFQLANLGDGREHWVAASPDQLALVEITGAENVEAASVSVFGPVEQQEDDGPRRAVYLLTMLNAILPGWEGGAAWFGDQVFSLSRTVGPYTAATAHAGVRITLTREAPRVVIILSFEPE